ncbi:MAG: FtsW/RodA/SpoVE family cell cycle protein [Phycisphaerae bacterium]|nr:FtsW/RodA/SpoVE family cell cycle protein [Phycisphaerae bacterium]
MILCGTGFQPVILCGTGFQPVILCGTGFQPVILCGTGFQPVVRPVRSPAATFVVEELTLTALETQPRSAATTRRLYDPSVVFIVGVLMALGVAMVYSASVTVQGAEFNWRQWWDSPLKQGVFVVAGFLAMLFAAHLDYRVLAWQQRWDGWRSGLLTLITLGLLLAVLLVGHQALGARRQLMIPGLPFGFQPSELAKIVLVIWLAALLTRPTAKTSTGRGRFSLLREQPSDNTVRRGDVRDFRTGFFPAVLSAGVLIGLTAIEDFGTAALMGVVMLLLLIISGARWAHLALVVPAALAAGALLILTKPHRIDRIKAFFSDTPDLTGADYQIDQAMLAIGSGGWWGRGLGAGVQKYGYLPQDNNDFILAIICEELGVVGGIVVVALFLLLMWRGWRIAANAPDLFGRLLALGLTLLLGLQAAFNVGVVTNSIPTKGISLPFVSAGGSGVVFLGFAVGLLASVGRKQQ